MRTRTATFALAALLLATVTACSSEKSEEEIASDCQKALVKNASARMADRPDACKGLSDDDYEALFLGQKLKDSGLVDQDGNVDMNELLDDGQ